jgi:ADP-ribose pyrophosphatase YjhB (NUDIX family)
MHFSLYIYVGNYLLFRDANKPQLRLYAVPKSVVEAAVSASDDDEEDNIEDDFGVEDDE